MKSTRSLRIALVAPGIPRSATGVGMALAGLVEELCNCGHEVTVVTASTAVGTEPGEPMIEVDERADARLFAMRSRVHRRFHFSTEIRKWLNDNAGQFDVMDIQGIWSFVTAHAAEACVRARVPYVLTPHGQMARWDWKKMPLRKWCFYSVFLRKAWRYASAIRFVSEGEASDSIANAGGRGVIVPYWVDKSGMSDRNGLKRKVVTQLSLPENVPMILFLGRVTAQKGVLEIVEAFDRLRQRGRKVSLLVAGPLDGEYGARVKQAIARNPSRSDVHMLGPVYDENKRELFSAASLFITLSKNEGLPIALLEAMKHGLPVVTTNQAHLPEISQCEAGIVVSPDPGMVADVLDNLLGDHARLQAMGSNAKRLVQQRFTAEAVLPRMLALYESVIG
jgi:glycosyltransferase involved in cell wall biosynthesis